MSIKSSLFVASVAVFTLSACTDTNFTAVDATVVPVVVGDTAILSADTVVEAMLRAGFTQSELLEHGPALRNAISTRGGAQVRRGSTIHSVFSVDDGNLFVASKNTGTFALEL